MDEFKAYLDSIVQGLALNENDKADLEDEILDHLQLLKKKYMDEGLPEQEAVRKAMHTFGDSNRLQADYKKVIYPFRHWKTIVLVCASIYLLVVFRNLFFYYSFYMYPVERFVNLTPFATLIHYADTLQYINSPAMYRYLYGNVLMFIPFGFLLPLLSKRLAGLLPVLLLSAIFNAFLEFMQYITYTGTADIDDVILRTAGAIIGFCIYLGLNKTRSIIPALNRKMI